MNVAVLVWLMRHWLSTEETLYTWANQTVYSLSLHLDDSQISYNLPGCFDSTDLSAIYY